MIKVVIDYFPDRDDPFLKKLEERYGEEIETLIEVAVEHIFGLDERDLDEIMSGYGIERVKS